jgi:hypothetical protein
VENCLRTSTRNEDKKNNREKQNYILQNMEQKVQEEWHQLQLRLNLSAKIEEVKGPLYDLSCSRFLTESLAVREMVAAVGNTLRVRRRQ